MPHHDYTRCDDVDLVNRAQTGDPEAFGELYRRHVETIRAVVYKRMGGAARRHADDLVSETFTRAWANIHRFSWKGKPIVAWFMQIAINRVRDVCSSAEARLTEPRETASHNEQAGDDGDFTARIVRSEEAAALRSALSILTERQRACVIGRYFFGLPVRELATREGIAPTAVKALLHRAYKRLRTHMTTSPARPPDAYLGWRPNPRPRIASQNRTQ